MALPDDLADKLLNEPIEEMSHEFEVDLTCLVIANHKITMEGIAHAEDEELANLQESLKDETDREMVWSIVSYQRNFYDDLRVAARNLAVVVLVTRLQRWAGAYARRIDPKREAGQPIDKELNFLNGKLGPPPNDATQFFFDLAEVRHSVIHADSQPQWSFKGKTRSVDQRYVPNGYRVEVDDEGLRDAIAKAIAQIKWYDEKFAALHK